MANAGRQADLMESRIAAQKDMNAPISCERCGSTYFEEMKLYQYSALSYGSSDYRILSNQAKPMLRCICGYVRVPQARYVAGASATRQAAEAFTSSASAAKTYIDKNSPEQFAKSVASIAELKEVSKTLNSTIVDAIRSAEDKFKAEIENVKASIPASKVKATK